MKNLGIKIALSAMFSVLALGAFAQRNIDTDYSTQTIYENNQVIYSPQAEVWALDGVAENRVVLTKKVSNGTGNYSEYYGADDEIAFSFGTGAEFLYNDKLIAQDIYSLKFYSVFFNPLMQKFDKRNVTNVGLQKVFPDAKIVNVSDFKNDKIRVKKPLFKPVKILLVNDTPEYFYKYRFQGDNFEAYNVAGLLNIKKMGTIKFSHAGEDFKTLTIKVRPY
ncbi:MAG: hypothetical protein NC390_07220 [Fusobacterium sp.]|nr:hypothetical protein [Fusobacterium sp.]